MTGSDASEALTQAHGPEPVDLAKRVRRPLRVRGRWDLWTSEHGLAAPRSPVAHRAFGDNGPKP